jgi:hypothetical protein
MVTCDCGLHFNLAQVPNYKYRTRLFSVEKKFHVYDEKTRESRFRDLAQWAKAIIRSKSQNSNIRHDDILNCQKLKNVLPIFVATRNFLFIFVFYYFVFVILFFIINGNFPETFPGHDQNKCNK